MVLGSPDRPGGTAKRAEVGSTSSETTCRVTVAGSGRGAASADCAASSTSRSTSSRSASRKAAGATPRSIRNCAKFGTGSRPASSCRSASVL